MANKANKTPTNTNFSKSFRTLRSLFCTNTGKTSYGTYLNSVEESANQYGTSLVSLIKELTSNPIYRDLAKPGYIDPMSEAMTRFDLWTAGSVRKPKTIHNWKVAYKAFVKFHLGQYYGHIWLFKDLSPLQLCKRIAKSAIFASPGVVKDVVDGKLGTKENKTGLCGKINQCNNDNSNCIGWRGMKGNPYASWDHCAHARVNNAKRGSQVKDCNGLLCIADDNSYAKKHIKAAIIEKYKRLGLVGTGVFSDYVACHIWDNPDDCRYYASIANLVLVPRAIYGLTDHCDEVKAVLRLRATTLFGMIATLPKMDSDEEKKAKEIDKDLDWRKP